MRLLSELFDVWFIGWIILTVFTARSCRQSMGWPIEVIKEVKEAIK